MDYGPLLNELSGRKWVLEPHVIDVPDDTAKTNFFETPNGYSVPVVLADRRGEIWNVF